MGAGLLRVNKIKEKWRVKLAHPLETRTEASISFMVRLKYWSEKYVMFILSFITVPHEGLEAIVCVECVGLGFPASSFPLAVFCGLCAGISVGYIMYEHGSSLSLVSWLSALVLIDHRGGSSASLQYFLILSTSFFYLISTGLFSRAAWYFENNAWNHVIGSDASETGSEAGSYDIRQRVWHVNCCNPELGGGGEWGIFNALLGWTNSATYGSVLSYSFYWIILIISYFCMQYQERHGYIPVSGSSGDRSCRRRVRLVLTRALGLLRKTRR